MFRKWVFGDTSDLNNVEFVLFCIDIAIDLVVLSYYSSGRMPVKSNTTAAERLKIVIENAGLSTYALSRHIGLLRPENLYQILRGKCGISKNMANIIHQKFPQYSIDWLIYGDNNSQEPHHDNIVRIPLYNNFDTQQFPPLFPADEILTFSSTLAANAQIAIAYSDDYLYPNSQKSILLLRKKTIAEEICYGNMYLIITDQLRLVRYVYKSPESPKKLLLNTMPESSVGEMTIERILIRSMWIVCTVIYRTT